MLSRVMLAAQDVLQVLQMSGVAFIRPLGGLLQVLQMSGVAFIRPLGRNSTALQLADIPTPTPQSGEILIKVSACGVCHTELDEIEGRTPPPSLPVVPGQEVVGVGYRALHLSGLTNGQVLGLTGFGRFLSVTASYF